MTSRGTSTAARTAPRTGAARKTRLQRRLEAEIEKLKVLRGRRSRFSSAWSYWRGDTELLHFHDDGTLDVRLTRTLIRARWEEFARDPRIQLGARSRDWVVVRLMTDDDVRSALGLVRAAIAAHRQERP